MPPAYSTAQNKAIAPGASLPHLNHKAEDAYEILCNDVVLPLDMTLAAVRQFIWRNAGELVMHYRRKAGSATEA
jgi:WD repeat-containing protein 48